ncbi:MAG TPA: porin family protein [Chitinophagaceae bacterium]|nr:porin family protein [Chitinophagaceae bacterium]
MKKGIVLAVAIVAGLIGHSQIRIGVYGAGSLSKASFTKDEGLAITSKPVYAPSGGVVADIPLSEKFSIRPSLGVIQKGVKATATGTDGTVTGIVKSDIKMNYAEMPVLLTFKKQAGNTTLVVGAGPSFGLGMGGKLKTASYLDNIPDPLFTFEANPFKKSDHIDEPFKRFDFSASAMIGAEFKNGFFISANYLHGLSNISGSSQDSKFRNRTASVGIGYFFGR